LELQQQQQETTTDHRDSSTTTRNEHQTFGSGAGFNMSFLGCGLRCRGVSLELLLVLENLLTSLTQNHINVLSLN
jgi:hypothetical protein